MGEFSREAFFAKHRYDKDHSPMWYLITSAPFLLIHESDVEASLHARPWLPALPYLAISLLLGASLWYVARRLYGNAGGYVALTLYCFSPTIIRSTVLWFSPPETGAAWGAFGAIFTAIAVSHTLYAPREVVLWNWRRILLLGLSFALAVGSQFSLILLLPLALIFMLYLAHVRKHAAIEIWAAACVIAVLLLFVSYSFSVRDLWGGLRGASYIPVSSRAFLMAGSYSRLIGNLAQASPVLVAILPIALLVFAFWPRTRYFGNSAPLLISVVLLTMSVGSPHYPGLGFGLVVLPFLFVFTSGIVADLLETQNRQIIAACTAILLAVGAVWNIIQLATVPVT